MNKTLLRAFSYIVIFCNVHAADDNPRKLDDTFLQQRLKNRKIYDRKREDVSSHLKNKYDKNFFKITIISFTPLLLGGLAATKFYDNWHTFGLSASHAIISLSGVSSLFLASYLSENALNQEALAWQQYHKLYAQEPLALRHALDEIKTIKKSQKTLLRKSIFTLVDRRPITELEDALKDKILLSKILPEALHSIVQEALALKKEYPDEWAQFITNR